MDIVWSWNENYLPTLIHQFIKLIQKSKPMKNCRKHNREQSSTQISLSLVSTHQSWRVAMRSSSLYKKNLQKRRNTQWKSLKLNSQRNNIEQVKNIYSFSPSFTWVPPNLGKRTLSPSLTETGIRFPVLSLAPGPTAITLPEFNCVHSNPSNFMFFNERIGSREALYLRRCFR